MQCRKVAGKTPAKRGRRLTGFMFILIRSISLPRLSKSVRRSCLRLTGRWTGRGGGGSLNANAELAVWMCLVFFDARRSRAPSERPVGATVVRSTIPSRPARHSHRSRSQLALSGNWIMHGQEALKERSDSRGREKRNRQTLRSNGAHWTW